MFKGVTNTQQHHIIKNQRVIVSRDVKTARRKERIVNAKQKNNSKSIYQGTKERKRLRKREEMKVITEG